MVTSSVRVLHWIHAATANPGPAIALHTVLVVIVAGLQDRLVQATTAGGDADNCATSRGNGLPGTRWQTNPRLPAVVGVANDHAGGAGAAGDATAIASLLLAHRHDGALGHLVQGQHIANGQLRLGTTIHELAGVQTLHGDPLRLHDLVAVRVTELDLAHRGTTAWIMDDIRHEAVALRIVDGAKLHGALAQPGLPH